MTDVNAMQAWLITRGFKVPQWYRPRFPLGNMQQEGVDHVNPISPSVSTSSSTTTEPNIDFSEEKIKILMDSGHSRENSIHILKLLQNVPEGPTVAKRARHDL